MLLSIYKTNCAFMSHSSIRETSFEGLCASPGLEEIVSKAHTEGRCGLGHPRGALSA
jgi:hypothetical protein